MKKYSYLLSALLVVALSLGVVSCNKDNNTEKQLPKAKVTGTKYYKEDKMTAYNIEHPSKDPFGNPCTLSGTITVGDEILNGKEDAAGVVPVNHFTVYRKDQCPSKGDLIIQKFIVGSKMVGDLKFSTFASEEIQDMNSEVSKKLTAALDKENLAKGWKPAKGARIALVHHRGDITWMDDQPEHQNGAIDFALRIFEILTTEYGFPLWIINEDALKQMVDDAIEAWYKEFMGKAA